MKKRSISTQAIEEVVNKTENDKISIADIVSAMETVGFGLVLVIFALASIMPLPPPLPNIFAIPIMIFALQMVLGYDSPKLPKKIGKIKISRSIVALIVQKTSRYIGKVEKILKPRLSFFVSPFFERFLGVIIFCFGSFVIIPLPFTNFIPGIGIMLIAFGLLGKDGLFVIIGSIIGSIGMTISILAIFVGVEIINKILDWLF